MRHSVLWPGGGDIDSVAVAPSGVVFAIETKTMAYEERHLRRVREVCESGGGMLDADTVVSAKSYELALLSLGGVLTACDVVMEGQAKRSIPPVRILLL